MRELIPQLKKDVAELEAFEAELSRRQVKFPLDVLSQQVVHKDLMIPTGNLTYPADINSFGSDAIEVMCRGKRYLIKAK